MAHHRAAVVGLGHKVPEDGEIIRVLNEVESAQEVFGHGSNSMRTRVDPATIKQADEHFRITKRFAVHEGVVHVYGQWCARMSPEPKHQNGGVQCQGQSGKHDRKDGVDRELAEHNVQDSSDG